MGFLIIEDQAMIRSVLVKACLKVAPGRPCFVASDLASGLALAKAQRPRLIVLDIVLPDGDGLAQLAELRAAAPGVKIIVVTSFTDDYTLHRIQRLAVEGFVSKTLDGIDVFIQAIRQVLEGTPFFSQIMFREMEKRRSRADAFTKILSAREQQLLPLIGRGWNDKQIAEHLKLSPNTVRNHRQRIMDKLDIHTTPELIHYALEKGFVRHKTL